MILRAENIVFGYHADHPVLQDVSLELTPGKVTALFGPNGCGKSTLLRCMNGALQPQEGRVLLDGRHVEQMSPRELARLVAVVPQDTPADVPFTVREMVMLGRYAHWDAWGQERHDDAEIVRDCLARMEIAGMAGRFFNQLSGGERQRVIIARALAQQCKVLLLDEPASHLDIAHQLQLYRLVRQLAAEGQAVLMVCHDILVAPLFVDSAVLMTSGRIFACGSPAETLTAKNIGHAFGCSASIQWESGNSIHAQLDGVL